MKTCILLLLSLTLLNGCVTKGWQGLVPGKDVTAENFSATLSTPWGTQTIKADKFTTRVTTNGVLMVAPEPTIITNYVYVPTIDVNSLILTNGILTMPTNSISATNSGHFTYP